MVFTAPVFLFLFLPLVAGIHFIMKDKYRNMFIFLASSAFYYYGEQNLLFLMYGVILINYITALGLEYIEEYYQGVHTGRFRKLLLALCVTICVGLLWHYKYWTFTLSIFNKFFELCGIEYALSLADKIILPLGISFYTFHCLSYTFDVYLRKMKADHNLLNFMCYVLMFPQLVAGPIVRYIDIKGQFEHRIISTVGIVNGIRRFCYGLAKKVLIANTVALSADEIFSLPFDKLDFCTAWVGAICYTLQIYFDFSGYSDMAIGLALLFGFRYKENFNYPYISKSISEFWRRWHISLSTWLRDYVYISLGGNRVTKLRYYFNLFIVMLLSGLWHGANWTFVFWGGISGVFLILEAAGLKGILSKHKIFAHCYVFIVIVFGWVIFRADSLHHGISYWYAMINISNYSFLEAQEYLAPNIVGAIGIGMFFSLDWRNLYKKIVIKTNNRKSIFLLKLTSIFMAAVLYVIAVMSIFSNTYNPFIYFRF